jgi:hypothetical protein
MFKKKKKQETEGIAHIFTIPMITETTVEDWSI